MVSGTAIGYLATLISIVFFGTFALPVKSKKVQEAKADAVVFQIYYSFAVFLTSWLALTYVPFRFTWFGVVGAALWVPSSILAINAINYLGLSIAQGMWSGITIVISFVWGVILHDPIKDIYLSLLALFMLLVGIGGISLCKNRYYIYSEKDLPHLSEKKPLINQPEAVKHQPGASNTVMGTMCAVLLGLLNGSMMVPTRFIPPDCQGVNYLVSFGIGVAMVTPVVALLYYLFCGVTKRPLPKLHVRTVMLPGLMAGVMWNIGNVGSIYATLYLGLTIGFPLTQLALLVAGLWGMFLFRELPGVQPKLQFLLAAGILLGGALLLALFG